MNRLAALLLLLATLGASTATAGELADAKKSFDRWMGCGYSDGYHASKCYRPGGACHPCECLPYSPYHPRNPSRAVGQSYFSAAYCYQCEGGAYEPAAAPTTPMTVREEVVEPKPIERAAPKSTP
jgi:hypothetical protein